MNASATASNAQVPSPGGGFIYALTTLVTLLPQALLWTVTFCSITLPTWLFTLFSMTLTFTMNFTTL